MTYVIGGENVNGFDELNHAGVKGMKWGVRKDRTSGGSRLKSSSKSTRKPRPSMTPEQRKAVGKKVVAAVVATAGGVAVGSLAGPIAGAAVGAAVRGVFETTTTVRGGVGGSGTIRFPDANSSPEQFGRSRALDN